MKVVPDFHVELRYDVTNHRDGVKRPKIVTYYLAELEASTAIILSEEHRDFKWLGLDEAVNLCGFEDMAKAFRTCNDKIGQMSNSSK